MLVSTAIIAAALVANPSSAEAANSEVTVSDNFGDAALNSYLWSVTTTTNGATATIDGATQTLKTTTPAAEGVSSTVTVASLVALTGDFDVTVSYANADSLNHYWMHAYVYVMTCDGQNGIGIYRARSSGSTDTIESAYFLFGQQYVPANYWVNAGSYTASGKFRIVRSGNTLTTYYGSGEPLSQLVSQTHTAFSSPVRIHVSQHSNDLETGPAPEASVRWDDLIVHSKGATGCP
ncbi:MAG TPA: hypothetical protein VFL83_21525 [Anaeromyxobacter sp.]|nr:hypothetical protein [Anaeromyxobacter sp.]